MHEVCGETSIRGVSRQRTVADLLPRVSDTRPRLRDRYYDERHWRILHGRGKRVITFEIEEKVFGEPRETLVREVEGTEVSISAGVLQIWERSSDAGQSRLVANVALERLVVLKSREVEVRWDGVERRVRLAFTWDGVDRRVS